MRIAIGAGTLVALAACGNGSATPHADAPRVDASPLADASIDAPVDAIDAVDAPIDAVDASIDAPCPPTPLLTGGANPIAQGWTVVTQAPDTLGIGSDDVTLTTRTETGASTGGQLLLSYADAVVPGEPFALEFVVLVTSVSPHDPLDAGAALLGSFTAPAGTMSDRSEMIYLDAAAIGWGDDTQSAPFTVTDGAYHTYLLDVDATGSAQVSVDGVSLLARTGYTTSGTIAIGDQTNDPNVDGAMQIRSISKLCR